jgi:hypothetical protein
MTFLPGTTPQSVELEFFGIANGTCGECEDLNDITFILGPPREQPGNQCQYRQEFFDTGICTDDEGYVPNMSALRFHVNPTAFNIQLTVFLGSTPGAWGFKTLFTAPPIDGTTLDGVDQTLGTTLTADRSPTCLNQGPLTGVTARLFF